jgi:iron complex transport system substrate-binding protein
VGKPVVSAARIDPSRLSSAQIDQAVRESVRDGRSLYAIDAELIGELAPDLIVTQDLCAVCAVSGDDVAAACPVEAEVLSLDPRTLGEVSDSVLTLGERLGALDAARRIVDQMWSTIDEASARVRGRPRPRVFFAEWIDPPFCAGHWIPEMIDLAGGSDVLGRPGLPSRRTSWPEALAAGPELIVLGPCGFGAEETAARAAGLDLDCEAVAVDGDSYYSRPAPRLAEGVRQLAHLFHPEAVADPGLPAIRLGGAPPKAM